MALASASTDMGLCLEISESLPPSDECASTMAFMLINHGHFVLFLNSHIMAHAQKFPRRSFPEVGLEALAASALGRVVLARLGFPRLSWC